MLIKQFIKYVVKTDWCQIRSDYKRWKLLCAASRDMAVAVNDEKSGIKSIFINTMWADNFYQKSCLNYIYSTSPHNQEIEYAIIPCKCFDASHVCTESNCKYHTQNVRYVTRNAQYSKVRNEKRKFWAEKFANVK